MSNLASPSAILTSFGSDKCTEHSYGDFYDDIFRKRRIASVLEIGVEAGLSLQAWKHILGPDALVIGVDKDDEFAPLPAGLTSDEWIKATKLRHENPLMMRFGDSYAPYVRARGLDVIRAAAPDFSPVISRCRRENLKFDMVIDDGSHIEADQVLGYHYLSEFVRDGGVYIIEDVQNGEIMDRFERTGWNCVDLRGNRGKWGDIIVWREVHDKSRELKRS